MPTIEFSSVSVAFDDTVVLEDINLTLTEQRIGIIGQNGGGKSTLTRLINGLGEPSEGTVTVDQMDVAKQGKKVREKVGFVFSDAENQIVMPNVRDDVAFSLTAHAVWRTKAAPCAGSGHGHRPDTHHR